MLKLHFAPCTLCLALCLLLLSACAPATPSPTAAPRPPTLIPSPTPRPTLTPTATPIPSLRLSVAWPQQVSALHPAPIAIELQAPPGVNAIAVARAAVFDPEGIEYRSFVLAPKGQGLYASAEPLQLSLNAMAGNWRVVVYVESNLAVKGQREFIFQPLPVRFWNLSDVLPPGASLRMPQEFKEIVAQGDQWAGERVWRYGDSELGLWWAPGPTEPLLLNTAIVMLETTFFDKPPQILSTEKILWQERPAFLFSEDWRATQRSSEPRPAQALVAQDASYWLYVLRAQTTSKQPISPLVREVWETFNFKK